MATRHTIASYEIVLDSYEAALKVVKERDLLLGEPVFVPFKYRGNVLGLVAYGNEFGTDPFVVSELSSAVLNNGKIVDASTGDSVTLESELTRIGTIAAGNDRSIGIFATHFDAVDASLGSLKTDFDNLLASVSGLSDTVSGYTEHFGRIDSSLGDIYGVQLPNKVDKVEGKELSENDFTDTYKAKLDSLFNYDDASIIARIDGVASQLKTLIGSDDVSEEINTFNEVVAFLDKYKNADSLSTVLSTLESTIHDWVDGKKYLTEHQDISGKVDSSTLVNGHPLTGDVTVTKSDVGLGNVDNTSDADKPVSTAVSTELGKKVDKVEGKGLSTNDYTTDEKTKLSLLNDVLKYTAQALTSDQKTVARQNIGAAAETDMTASVNAAAKSAEESASYYASMKALVDNATDQGTIDTILAASQVESKVDENTSKLSNLEEQAVLWSDDEQEISDLDADYLTKLNNVISDTASLSQEVDNIEDRDNAMTKHLNLVSPINLLNINTLHHGYYVYQDGSINEASGYCYTDKIPVSSGETINLWLGDNPTNISQTNAVAFVICAYDKYGNAISESGANPNVHTYVVPQDICYIVLTFTESLINLGTLQMIKGTTTPTTYTPYFDKYYIAESSFYLPKYSIERTSNNLSSGDKLSIGKMNLGKNVVMTFRCDITTFEKITISQALGEYYGGSIEIDNTNVTLTIENNPYTYAHGLTITKYLCVRIEINDNNRISVYLFSNNQSYEKTNLLIFRGFADGKYEAACNSGTLTNCKFTVSCKDFGNDVFVFGDSYIAIAESTHTWTHFAIEDGYGDNFLMNAFPGENSSQAYDAFCNVLAVNKPKYIVWALGMNDGSDIDINTPSSSWKTYFKKVYEYCIKNNIEMIAVTIPTISTILNEGKNYFIKNSGLRYIDVAQALGADQNGNWYSDLNYDGTHPTEFGAKLIWNQVLTDFPEIVVS